MGSRHRDAAPALRRSPASRHSSAVVLGRRPGDIPAPAQMPTDLLHMLQPKRVKVSWRPLVVGWWPGDANLKASTIKNQAIVRSETDVALNGCICLTFHFVIEDYLQHSLNVKVGWCDALRVFSKTNPRRNHQRVRFCAFATRSGRVRRRFGNAMRRAIPHQANGGGQHSVQETRGMSGESWAARGLELNRSRDSWRRRSAG